MNQDAFAVSRTLKIDVAVCKNTQQKEMIRRGGNGDHAVQKAIARVWRVSVSGITRLPDAAICEGMQVPLRLPCRSERILRFPFLRGYSCRAGAQ